MRQHSVRVGAQVSQQAVFQWGQVHGDANALHDAQIHVDLNVTKGHDRGAFNTLHAPAQLGPDSCEQLTCTERLHQIVIGAGIRQGAGGPRAQIGSRDRCFRCSTR